MAVILTAILVMGQSAVEFIGSTEREVIYYISADGEQLKEGCFYDIYYMMGELGGYAVGLELTSRTANNCGQRAWSATITFRYMRVSVTYW